MGLIYDVFYFRPDGTCDAGCDLGAAAAMPESGRYTKIVNTNGGEGTTWYGPDGREVPEASLPWVARERAEREARERAARDRARRVAAAEAAARWDRLTGPGPAEAILPDGVLRVWGEEARDGTRHVAVRLLGPDRRPAGGGIAWAALATWQRAVAEWADGPADDPRTQLYSVLGTMIPATAGPEARPCISS